MKSSSWRRRLKSVPIARWFVGAAMLCGACATTPLAEKESAPCASVTSSPARAVAFGAAGAAAGGVGAGVAFFGGIEAYAAAIRCDERGVECEGLNLLLIGGLLPVAAAGAVLGAGAGVVLASTLSE